MESVAGDAIAAIGIFVITSLAVALASLGAVRLFRWVRQRGRPWWLAGAAATMAWILLLWGGWLLLGLWWAAGWLWQRGRSMLAEPSP